MRLPCPAALLGVVAALQAGRVVSQPVTPVAKVIDLLEGLKTEIETEGAAEAKTYDEYACFCKDKTSAKSTSILDGQDTIDSLSASIADDTATMNGKELELQDQKAKLEKLKGDLAAETERCLKEAAEFEADLDDLNKACFALDKALAAMKKSMPAGGGGGGGEEGAPAADEGGRGSLLQLRGAALGAGVADAVKLGEALGLVTGSGRQAASSLLQVDPNDPEYKYHSDSIVELLEKLKVQFDAKKTETQAEYKKAQKICKDTKQQLSDDIDETDNEISSLELEIDGLQKSIAQNRRSLVDSEAMLKDDKVYLHDLTERCEAAAKQWDQRSAERGRELEALAEALVLLKGDATGPGIKQLDTEANERALLQRPKPALQAAAGARDPPSFLQQGGRSLAFRSKAGEVDRKSQAEQVLREAAARLGSPVLAELAAKVGGDPFKKVKKMIQDLIERLLDEAKKEATKQGFCDKELGKAYQDRDFRLSDARKLAAEIGIGRAKNETLTADIAELEEVLPQLYQTLNETTELRAEEKEENLQRIKTAKGGVAAVTEAIVILKTYYKQAAKALLQRRASPVDEDTEGPGFSGAYRGKQDQSKGIIGLLEVIKSDFDRTVRHTMAEEKQAQEEFVEFERVTKTDISGKEEALELKSEDQAKVHAAMEKALADLKTTQGLLDDALKTVESLKPMCLDWGQLYAERSQKRQEEIAALKRCLEILAPPAGGAPAEDDGGRR